MKIGIFARKLMESKCRYRNYCKIFDPDSDICIKHGGMYYAYDKPAGCFRRFKEKK